ncbi:condensation domain-containing protein [Rhodococcus sp. UNC23MFCrub1.1]|uniref:condensation domain-containing protein n=1 Tax=Rhodococcus sp. UNC23MFCrub1.1 TaxID=1449068 RepID=UPI00047F5BD2|nr:condensation domain-containing protein [Rhodococcus sp. UNC23MFCrub1.1]
MEFTELADHPLPRGVVTEWIPTVTATDRWYRDDRPLAYTHEEHCRHSLAKAATGSSDEIGAAWIGAVFEIHDRYDAEALRRALRAWTSRHETFRSTVTTDGVDADGGARLARSTVPEDAVDVVPRVLGRRRTGSDVHADVSDFFARTLSPFRWPHCVVATVEDIAPGSSTEKDDETDRFLLVFGADHSVMDAYSMLLAVSELRRLYEFEIHARDPRLAAIGSHLDFSVVDRETGDCLTPDHEVVRTWSSFLSDGSFPPFPLPVGADDEHGPERQSSLSRYLLSAADTDALAAHTRARGASMTAAVVGALALTSRDLAGERRLRVTMPMHTRFEPQYAESVGWYVGVVPVDVHVDPASDVDDAVRRAAAGLDAVKGYARQPYSRVARLLNVDSVPQFVVSYLDLRHTPDAESWPLWNTRTLRSATASRDEVYFWILRTPLGLSIAARFPGHEEAVRNVHAYLARFQEVLRESAGAVVESGADRTVHA